MKKIKDYVYTFIFGGVFDYKYKKASSIFFEQVKSNLFTVIASPIVQNEISLAAKQVQDYYAEILSLAETIDVSDEALELIRDSYLKANIV